MNYSFMEQLFKNMAAMINKFRRHRSLVMSFAVVVTFATTYMLILPAITLDKEAAAEMPGIDTQIERVDESETEASKPAAESESADNDGAKDSDGSAADEKKSEKSHTESGDSSKSEGGSKSGDGSKSEDGAEAAAGDEAKAGDGAKDSDESADDAKKSENSLTEGTDDNGAAASAGSNGGVVEKVDGKTLFTFEGEGCQVQAEAGADANLPEGAELCVTEIGKDTKDENGKEYEYEDYRDKALEAVRDADGADGEKSERKVRLYDIGFVADGKEVEPAAPVKVTITYSKPVEVSGENPVRAVHFDETKEEAKAEVLEAEAEIKSGTKMEDTSFEAERFSVFAVVYTVGVEGSEDGEAQADAKSSKLQLKDSAKRYDVTVSYGEAAGIPEGASLRVTEFTKKDKEYEYARSSVLADKKARGEDVDLDRFGLAALDISILNADGKEIEPEAPVQVEIRVKDLPGVESLSEIEDTLAIQHHVEVKDGVVVETVFDGNTKANFQLNTNEKAAEDGIVVDPGSVSEEDFVKSEATKSSSSKSPENDEIDVTFQTPVFSTFTVTWNESGGGIIEDNVNYLYASAADVETHNFRDNGTWVYDTFQTNNLYLMDSNTNVMTEYLSRTSAGEPAKGDIYLVYNHTGNGAGDQNVSEADSTFHITFNNDGSTYADVTVHYVDSEGNPIRRTKTSDVSYTDGSVDTRFVDGTNSSRTLTNYAGTKNGYTFVGVSAKRPEGPAGPHATVHYGYMDGNNFVEFEEQPSPVQMDPNHHAYLIYDFDGYQYAGRTYYRTSEAVNGVNMTSGATSIQARLVHYNNRWLYWSNNWNYVADGSHIYVVYNQKAEPEQGGTPTIKQSAEYEPPAAPTITKESTVNGDGTNTLALSVSGHTADLEVEKLADVIVVFDVSGSMSTSDMTGETRLKAGRDSINTLAHVLLNKTNTYGDKLIRMGLVTFSTDAQVVQELTDDESVFKSAVDRQTTAEGGTNWEKALMLANQMKVDSGRATFVIFVTDGDPTFRISRQGETDANLDMYGKDNDDTYYVSNSVFGEGNDDTRNNNYQAAKTEAESIISHKKTLYTIAISSDAAHLNAFADDVGAAGKYTATSTSDLTRAFDDIASSIIALMGHSDIQISDGITDLTQTVQKSTLVTFAEDDFTYTKERQATQEEINDHSKVPEGAELVNRSGTYYVVWENWDPSAEGCAPAVYNTETGAVEWNMGETFMLEEGYTYQVKFKVWPSQEAYDLLADLNNGKKTYDGLTPEEKAQITEPATEGGMYKLKTNSETSYTYREATKSGDTVTPTSEPSEPGSFPDVDPLELTTKPLKVMKQWHNNYVDSRTLVDHITMELYGVDPDGTTSHDFKTITLSKEDGWYAENNYVSYGLVTYDTATDKGEKVYETGHDFTLRETDDEAHYYELTAGIYRPMFINGTPTILEKVDAAPADMEDDVFHYTDGSTHYYRLDGKIYQDTQSDILLIATNSHRSYMDLNKVVIDESGSPVVDDSEFEYQITFTVPPDIANHDDIEKYIWFSVYDTVARRTLATNEYTHSNLIIPSDLGGEYSDPSYANYLVATSGEAFTLKIKQGWNVRFLNLPIGTTYSFEEKNIGETHHFVKAEVSGTRWIANMVDGVDRGAAQTMSSLPSNTSGDDSDTEIGGTIDFANARYSTTYTNRTITEHVDVLKTSEDGNTPLPGAVFSLYTESGYAATPKKPSQTGLTSNANGKVDLGKVAYGTYYLVETAAPAGYNPLSEPVVITVASTGVTYQQSDNSHSMSGEGVHYDPDTKTHTLTVTNNAGYELPHTGGPGTRLLTGLGAAVLLLSACALFAVRRRMRRA